MDKGKKSELICAEIFFKDSFSANRCSFKIFCWCSWSFYATSHCCKSVNSAATDKTDNGEPKINRNVN